MVWLRLPVAVIALVALAMFALAGCPSPAPPAAAPASAGWPAPVARVVTLAPGSIAAVVGGPVVVTSVNPGTNLELALVEGDTCTGDALWFAYSGGGVAVPAGQTLCARSRGEGTVVHAFSGR